MYTKLATGFAACLLALSLTSCQSPGPIIRDQEQFTKQVTVSPNISVIEIHHDNGSVNLKGWDRPFVLMEGYKSVSGPDLETVSQALSEMEMVAYERSGDRLVIEYSPPLKFRDVNPFDKFEETVHFTINVPKGITIEVYNKDGAIKAVNLDKALIVDHKVGDVVVENIKGGVQINSESGNISATNIDQYIDLESSGGRADIEKINGDVSIRHKNGSVIVSEVNNDVYLNCENADCTVRQIKGQLEVDNIGGDVVANYIYSGVAVKLRKGSLTLQPQMPVSQSYICNVEAGDLTVRIPEDSNILLDITAESGGITSDYPLSISSEKNTSKAAGAVNKGEFKVELSVKGGFAHIVKVFAGEIMPDIQAKPFQQQSMTTGSAQPAERSPDLEATDIN